MNDPKGFWEWIRDEGIEIDSSRFLEIATEGATRIVVEYIDGVKHSFVERSDQMILAATDHNAFWSNHPEDEEKKKKPRRKMKYVPCRKCGETSQMKAEFKPEAARVHTTGYDADERAEWQMCTHCYWLFKEAMNPYSVLEALHRVLSDHIKRLEHEHFGATYNKKLDCATNRFVDAVKNIPHAFERWMNTDDIGEPSPKETMEFIGEQLGSIVKDSD